MTTGCLTAPIFLIFQNNTLLKRTGKPTHRKLINTAVSFYVDIFNELIELELAFGMVFT